MSAAGSKISWEVKSFPEYGPRSVVGSWQAHHAGAAAYMVVRADGSTTATMYEPPDSATEAFADLASARKSCEEFLLIDGFEE